MGDVKKWETETHFRTYNNKTGEYYEVRPDTDLGLISIRSMNSTGAQREAISFSPAVAEHIQESLAKLIEAMGESEYQ